MKIPMVDLRGQYDKIKPEIDLAIQECIHSTRFIGGPVIERFAKNLGKYLDCKYVIPCANGTDALQIALMAAGLKPGDEVIVPSFTYVATAEVITLLGLVPVMTDVDPEHFNLTKDIIRQAVSVNTKAIVPVHLFGQTAPMEGVMEIAEEYGLTVIEDNAQSLGSDYTFSNHKKQKAGTIGDIGTTSFFPAKNLGAYGDGGALFTNDDELFKKIKMIANHGQSELYHHEVIGVNSRLDALQAAVLDVKLKYYGDYLKARKTVAAHYDQEFADMTEVVIPHRHENSTHVFHQYTLKVLNGKRDELKEFLKNKGISSSIYYPIPLNEQNAFRGKGRLVGDMSVTKALCDQVLSLPIHTEMDQSTLAYITEQVKSFFNEIV